MRKTALIVAFPLLVIAGLVGLPLLLVVCVLWLAAWLGAAVILLVLESCGRNDKNSTFAFALRRFVCFSISDYLDAKRKATVQS